MRDISKLFSNPPTIPRDEIQFVLDDTGGHGINIAELTDGEKIQQGWGECGQTPNTDSTDNERCLDVYWTHPRYTTTVVRYKRNQPELIHNKKTTLR